MTPIARRGDPLRVRRHQPTRLEGFIDASFAFAVTLLMISFGRVPTSVPDMLQALRGLPAFAFSALLIARIWKSHRDWSRYYDIEDDTSLRLSLLLVLVVLTFVYPLRLLFSLLFAWISHGFLVDPPVALHSIEELRAAFEVYGLGFGAIGLLLALLYRHALRRSGDVGLDPHEIVATRMHVALWMAFAALAGLSTLAAALLPFRTGQPLLFALPGMIYALSSVVAPLIRRHYAKAIAGHEPAS
jgi:hypothetical protein